MFRRLGATLEEAARVAGANTFTTLWRVTFPVLSPMILAIAMLSFIRGLEAFNTELLLGLPANIFVYGTRIYDYLRQEPPAYGEATALGSVFLLVLAVLALAYRRWFQGNKKFTVVTGQGYSTMRVKLGKWRYVAIGGFGAVVHRHDGVAAGVSDHRLVHAPLWLLQHQQSVHLRPLAEPAQRPDLPGLVAEQPDDRQHDGHLRHSDLLGVGYLLASPRKLRTKPALEFFCWLPWVIPGILMSLGLLWIFLATPLRGVLYGTVLGIAVALTIQDSPVSTQAFKSAFLQLGGDLEEAARVAGGSWTLYLPAHPAPARGARRADGRHAQLRQCPDQHQHAGAAL